MEDDMDVASMLGTRFDRLLEAQLGGVAALGEALDEVAQALGQATPIEALDVQVPGFMQAAQFATAAREQQLEPAYASVVQAAQEAASQAGTRRAAWHDLLASLHDALAACTDALAAVAGAHEAQAENIVQSLDAAAAGLVQGFAQVEAGIHAGSTERVPALRRALATGFADSHLQLDNALGAALPGAVGAVSRGFDACMREFDAAGAALVGAYAQTVRHTGDALQLQVEQQLGSAMQGVADGLRDVVLNRVGQAILQAGIETELNLAISTTLAPVMPELTAAYKALDLLEDAIEVFKRLQNPFG